MLRVDVPRWGRGGTRWWSPPRSGGRTRGRCGAASASCGSLNIFLHVNKFNFWLHVCPWLFMQNMWSRSERCLATLKTKQTFGSRMHDFGHNRHTMFQITWDDVVIQAVTCRINTLLKSSLNTNFCDHFWNIFMIGSNFETFVRNPSTMECVKL